MAIKQWKKYVVLTALAMALAGASVANAAPEEGRLTQEQSKKMHEIMKNHQKGTDSTRKQLLVKEAQLRGEMESATPDKGAIESLSKDIGELKGRLLSDHVTMDQEFEKAGIPVMRGMGHGPCDGMKGGMPHRMHDKKHEKMDHKHMKDRGEKHNDTNKMR